MTTSTHIPEDLERAGQALRQVLLRLDHYAKFRVQRLDMAAPYASSTMNHVRDLDALMTAVQDYEEATLACLAAAPAPESLTDLSPEQVLALRETDPFYRLGFVRGWRKGTGQVKQQEQTALSLYAQHATLPPPPTEPSSDYSALVSRVRRFLMHLTDRYGSGPIPRHQAPSRRYGTV
jgi:hypothetical protein